MINWINIKDKLPKDYKEYICCLRSADQSWSVFYMVLRYDFQKKEWCEKDPRHFKEDDRGPITAWWLVTHWAEINIPDSYKDSFSVIGQFEV